MKTPGEADFHNSVLVFHAEMFSDVSLSRRVFSFFYE